MAVMNENYCNLKESYLFSQIAAKVTAFVANNPDKKVIRMGIGDVTLPLAPAVVDAMKKAVEEMGVKETFRGYGPEQGYDFLHKALVAYYANNGVSLAADEIFISDGAKAIAVTLLISLIIPIPFWCRIRFILCMLIPISCAVVILFISMVRRKTISCRCRMTA